MSKYKILYFDVNNEEQTYETNGGNIDGHIDLIDFFMEYPFDMFQKCLDRVPKEQQTEETLKLLTTCFGMEFK